MDIVRLAFLIASLGYVSGVAVGARGRCVYHYDTYLANDTALGSNIVHVEYMSRSVHFLNVANSDDGLAPKHRAIR